MKGTQANTGTAMRVRTRMVVKQKEAYGLSSRFLEIQKGLCLIGRKNCDVVLSEPHCSRQHALLYLGEEGSLRVRDLASTNGTYLNSLKVTDAPVQIGDHIRLGRTILILVDFSFEAESQRPDTSFPALPAVTLCHTPKRLGTLDQAHEGREIAIEAPYEGVT